ncbi:MAG TPA: hypothetical protein PKD53_22650 [Chloroflexaceae bacterium]|nr:hypothetical protein [Chloroflexaceae bacterium]
MAARSTQRRKPRQTLRANLFGQLLDPIDRLSQTIYSVLIALTFTLAFRIFKPLGADAPPLSAQYVTDLFYAILGATLAWGLIDGLMYALLELFQRSERHRLLRQIKAAESEHEGVAVIAEELDYVLEPITGEGERLALYTSVFTQLRGGRPRPVGLTRQDFAGAIGSVLVSVLAVLPSLAPLLLLRHDADLAVRASNIVSFVVLFAAGYSWGRHTGAAPLKTGLLVLGLGVLMVAIAIPLGG